LPFRTGLRERAEHEKETDGEYGVADGRGRDTEEIKSARDREEIKMGRERIK